MRRWSEVAERVSATTRTSIKTHLLAGYLRTLDAAQLPLAAVFFAGRPFAEVDSRTTGLGWATISEAVAALAELPADALADAYDRSSDLGLAVADVLERAAEVRRAKGLPEPVVEPPSLADVAAAFAEIETAPGSQAKADRFSGLLARCDPLSARYVVKILTGELRIGLKEGLLEAALAEAFERPIGAVKRAGMLTGDVGRTALLAREDRLDSATIALFHPLKFMLASPAENAAEIIGRLGPTAWVEDKYDGIRAQLHRTGREVRLYSRDLHDITGQFPEVVAGARDLTWTGILDGEMLAYRDGLVMPFVALQKRLGRKDPSAAIRAEVPVIYVAFDLLALADPAATAAEPSAEALLDLPLSERRQRLETLGLPLADAGGSFALSHLVSVDSAAALERAFDDARLRRNEGLMVKDPASAYSPGRRGLGWLKMKKALATLDCVVIGVELGHGKRHGVLSDYTFAVRDEATDRLVTIGKAYTGLTDAQIAGMTAWFEAHTLARFGRYRTVEPTVVVEVAFDVIVRSSRHNSGFSLRFPRIARLRPDKDPAEIDTTATVEAVWSGLQHGAEQLVTAGHERAGRAGRAGREGSSG
ncbi:MAG TPA: ATP-dependent DNA ligase [Verrucomicrobiae bacterium]|nr:ATP-dependent DNA ligase [Verrucomicrobiae bacterium]